MAVVKASLIRCAEKLFVERLQILIDGLFRTAAQKYRQPHLAALELPFMEKLHSGKGGNDDRGQLLFIRRKGKCRPGFIMVFDEANKLVLIGLIRSEVQAKVHGIAVGQSIIEPLVITEIEAQLSWESATLYPNKPPR